MAYSMRRRGLTARRIKRRNGLTRQDKTASKFPDLVKRNHTIPGDVTISCHLKVWQPSPPRPRGMKLHRHLSVRQSLSSRQLSCYRHSNAGTGEKTSSEDTSTLCLQETAIASSERGRRFDSGERLARSTKARSPRGPSRTGLPPAQPASAHGTAAPSDRGTLTQDGRTRSPAPGRFRWRPREPAPRPAP